MEKHDRGKFWWIKERRVNVSVCADVRRSYTLEEYVVGDTSISTLVGRRVHSAR